MFLKKLFLASASVLMLALAYHLGASTATAQAPSNPAVSLVVNAGGGYAALTANGDVYIPSGGGGGIGNMWTRVANIFGGSPVNTTTQSWGSVKVQQR